MLEFTAWEVYAYEDGTSASSEEGQASSRPSSEAESRQAQSYMPGSNRLDRVVPADHLPQVCHPYKASAISSSLVCLCVPGRLRTLGKLSKATTSTTRKAFLAAG
jgi:hypothetical protein